MRGITPQALERLARIHRCVCGAWTYEGKQCGTCVALLRGREHELDSGTASRSTRVR